MIKKSINSILLDKYYKQLEFIQTQAPKKKDKGKNKRKKLALEDFEYFVRTYLPEHCQDSNGNLIPMGKFHMDFINNFETTNNEVFLCVWARGFSKSTLLKFLILWHIIKGGPFKNIVYVGNTKDMGKEKIMSIQTELEGNDLLIDDFGPFVTRGSWTKNKFVVKNEIQIAALGAYESPRGILFNSIRPDLIVCDDIDTDEISRNQERVAELYRWFKQQLKQTVRIDMLWKIVVIGNIYAPDMLLTRILQDLDKKFISFVPAINEYGKCCWPERFTLEQLERIRLKDGDLAFRREFMHEPIVEGQVFKEEWFLYKELFDPSQYLIIVSYYDPSYSKTGDYKSITTIGYHEASQEFHILDVYLRKEEMKASAYYLYDLYNRFSQYRNYTVLMESNFAQGMIHKNYIDEVGQERNQYLPLVYDEEKKANKIARIETMTPYFSNSKIYFDINKRSSLDVKTAISQSISFPSKHDDFLDSLESALNNINKGINSLFVPYFSSVEQKYEDRVF